MPKGEVRAAQAHQRRHLSPSAWLKGSPAVWSWTECLPLGLGCPDRKVDPSRLVGHSLLRDTIPRACAAWWSSKASRDRTASPSTIVGMILNLLSSLVTAVVSSPLVHSLVRQLLLLTFVLLVLLAAFSVRVLLLLPPVRSKLRLKVQAERKRQVDKTCKTALFLGSGEYGHASRPYAIDPLTPSPFLPRQAAIRLSFCSSPRTSTQSATLRAPTSSRTTTTSRVTRL